MNLNSLQNTNYKQKSLIATGLFIALIFVVFSFLIKPTIEEVKNLRLEILSQKIQIEKSINKEKDKSILAAKLKKIKPQLEQFNKIFVKKERDLEFITTLEGIADKYNLSQSISLNTEAFNPANAYSVVPLTLNVSGSFENITHFLNSLESSMYYLQITSFSLTKTESKDSMNMILKINTYWK